MRPVWFEAGNDIPAVAARLVEGAKEKTLRFGSRPVPDGIPASVLHQAALRRLRDQLATRHGEQDRVLAQEVRAIDDTVRAANLLVERLREWYGLHAPEAGRLVPDAERLARLVAQHGDRTALLAAIDQADAAAVSVGTDLDPADTAALQAFATSLAALHDAWRALETRVEALMREVSPNLAATVGPVIGARLIAQAGGLERLATWPAGTVQLIGAETALFRHIKEGTRPPKHGILFQHPLVHSAKPWQRGAIARALALAAATAAKADAFTKRDLKEHLAARVEKDLERIRQSRQDPPQRGPRGPARPGGRGPARGGPRRDGPGPRRDGPRRDGPRRDGPGGPRREGHRGPRRDGPGGPRRGGPRRDGPGPRRDGPRDGGPGPRRDGPRDAPRDGPTKGRTPGRARNRGPAPPPGRGDG